MKKDTKKTAVVFRKWRDKGTIALFPNIPGEPGMCRSYEHIGQHWFADYPGVIRKTTPASPEEYAELKRELESIGYNLAVRERRTRK